MEITMLGVNSAFAVGKPQNGLYDPKFQSNFLIEFPQEDGDTYKFVLDFGNDIRHSLAMIGKNLGDIDGWYCSHPHADHIGGVEGIALSTVFNPFYSKISTEIGLRGTLNGINTTNSPTKLALLNKKPVVDFLNEGNDFAPSMKPDLFGHPEVLDKLWKSAKSGLDTIQGVNNPTLSTFFNVVRMEAGKKKIFMEVKGSKRRIWAFYTVESVHVVAGSQHMPSYGLLFESDDGIKIYFPTDTLYMMPPTMETFYRKSTAIYQDCETGFKSGVHSHIDDIRKSDPVIKKKCYLYHYNEEPVVEDGEFAGILKRGEIHNW